MHALSSDHYKQSHGSVTTCDLSHGLKLHEYRFNYFWKDLIISGMALGTKISPCGTFYQTMYER